MRYSPHLNEIMSHFGKKCSHTLAFTFLTKLIELDFCGLAVGLIPISSLFVKYHQDVFPCHITSFDCVYNCCTSNPGSDYSKQWLTAYSKWVITCRIPTGCVKRNGFEWGLTNTVSVSGHIRKEYNKAVMRTCIMVFWGVITNET